MQRKKGFYEKYIKRFLMLLRLHLRLRLLVKKTILLSK